jgi:rare lipoprotein A
VDVSQIPYAVPRTDPRSRYGNPKTYAVFGKKYTTLATSKGYVERGVASFYGTKFHGRRTSSGETYDMYAMTAAHKTLPLPTYVRVTNLDNGRNVIVKINDRGPFHRKRIIDLSYAAAVKLDIAKKGTGRVEVKSLDGIDYSAPRQIKRSPATGPRKLYVQAGAFSTRQNAEALRRSLGRQQPGHRKVQIARNDTEELYKVYVGPFADGDEARRYSQTLRDRGISGAYVVLWRS